MSTKIQLTNLPTGFQTLITNGTHSIVGDEPIESNGTDLGLKPTELLLSGLAMCKLATIRNYARSKGIPVDNLYADLSLEVGRGNKALATTVDVKIKIEGDITEEQRTELLKQADRCYVHRMITGEWTIGNATEL